MENDATMGPWQHDFNCYRNFCFEDFLIMIELSDFVFYILGSLAIVFGLFVVLAKNPIYSALSLTLTMVFVAGLFWSLGAVFVAAVQIMVYAGAVLVLFVMVLMLFDLKQERRVFTKGFFSGFLKLAGLGFLLGVISHVIFVFSKINLATKADSVSGEEITTRL